MQVPIFYGIVSKGKLSLKDRERFILWVGSLEGEVQVIVRKPVINRSLQQNRLYWAYLTLISNETGNTTEDLHEFFKRKFLPPRFISFKGEEMKVPASTTKLDTLQFTEYLAKIAMLTGVSVPTDIEL